MAPSVFAAPPLSPCFHMMRPLCQYTTADSMMQGVGLKMCSVGRSEGKISHFSKVKVIGAVVLMVVGIQMDLS